MPGDGALARKRAALANGVALHPSIIPALEPLAIEYGITLPKPI
jgi:hypothetical protein